MCIRDRFESFLHPLVIMLTVPLGVLGALLGLWITGGTVNPVSYTHLTLPTSDLV